MGLRSHKIKPVMKVRIPFVLYMFDCIVADRNRIRSLQMKREFGALADNNPKSDNRMNEPIRLIDIPAIKTLEDKLLLGASLHGPLPHTLDAPIRDASLAVFGPL